jgi:hypothetical protein
MIRFSSLMLFFLSFLTIGSGEFLFIITVLALASMCFLIDDFITNKKMENINKSVTNEFN